MDVNQFSASATRVTMFRYWCQKVLPAVYDDSLSYYELLCKVVSKLNEVIENINNKDDGVTELQAAVVSLQEQLDYLRTQGFDEFYADKVAEWIMANTEIIFKNTINQVFFGLTYDGYFCAYVPQSWSEIDFDTGAVYGTNEYGRLILRYDVDGSGVIDNTGM